jgi:hypothetical protein
VKSPGNPTNAVGGSFIFNLRKLLPAPNCFHLFSPLAREGTEEMTNGDLGPALCRLSMNDPPTALVGFELSTQCIIGFFNSLLGD